MLLVGAARPRALVDVKRENATVVLAIDTSRSMQAIDVRPSRMDAIKLAALKFVKDLPAKYRVGIVDFATQASVAAPATRNRELVQKALEKLTPAEGPRSATGSSPRSTWAAPCRASRGGRRGRPAMSRPRR